MRKRNFNENFFKFHGEFVSGEKFPEGSLSLEHLHHLSLLEHLCEKKKNLRILDIATGSGEFSFFAKKRGHYPICTANTELHPKSIATISNFFDAIEYRRMFTRNLFGLNVHHLIVDDLCPIELSNKNFDAIYINQSTIHFPCQDSGRNRGWNNDEWKYFLSDLESYLKPGGVLFLTLAHSNFIPLDTILKKFEFPYNEIFPFQTTESHWPLFIFQKEETYHQ